MPILAARIAGGPPICACSRLPAARDPPTLSARAVCLPKPAPGSLRQGGRRSRPAAAAASHSAPWEWQPSSAQGPANGTADQVGSGSASDGGFIDFYSSGEWGSSSAEEADSWLEAAVGAASAALPAAPPAPTGAHQGQPLRRVSRRRLRLAAMTVCEALQGIAGCHQELAAELLLARPQLLLLDAEQQVAPKLELIAAAVAGKACVCGVMVCVGGGVGWVGGREGKGKKLCALQGRRS